MRKNKGKNLSGGVTLIITVVPPTPEQVAKRKAEELAVRKMIGRCIRQGVDHIKRTSPLMVEYETREHNQAIPFYDHVFSQNEDARALTNVINETAQEQGFELGRAGLKKVVLGIFKLAQRKLNYREDTKIIPASLCYWQIIKNRRLLLGKAPANESLA